MRFVIFGPLKALISYPSPSKTRTMANYVSETLRKLKDMSRGGCEHYMLKCSVLIPSEVCWGEHAHVEFGVEKRMFFSSFSGIEHCQRKAEGLLWRET